MCIAKNKWCHGIFDIIEPKSSEILNKSHLVLYFEILDRPDNKKLSVNQVVLQKDINEI